MKKEKQLIRFDWAMKKLLRNKANFDILEGFLSELLSEDITIQKILESEGNKDDKDDKHNRVDIFVEDSKGELIIIEVQNSKEYDYFHRILYGTSKAITEYIGEGDAYAKVKKVGSIQKIVSRRGRRERRGLIINSLRTPRSLRDTEY